MPPSVVAKMVPLQIVPLHPHPTAVQVLASGQERPRRFTKGPGDSTAIVDRTAQVAPPSVLLMIVPAVPTATTVWGLSTTTLFRVFPCGSGFCQNQPESARATAVRANAIKIIQQMRLSSVLSMTELR
jgi:hypothetical protein